MNAGKGFQVLFWGGGSEIIKFIGEPQWQTVRRKLTMST